MHHAQKSSWNKQNFAWIFRKIVIFPHDREKKRYLAFEGDGTWIVW